MLDFLFIEIISRLWSVVTIPILIWDSVFPEKEEVQNVEIKSSKKIKVINMN